MEGWRNVIWHSSLQTALRACSLQQALQLTELFVSRGAWLALSPTPVQQIEAHDEPKSQGIEKEKSLMCAHVCMQAVAGEARKGVSNLAQCPPDAPGSGS